MPFYVSLSIEKFLAFRPPGGDDFLLARFSCQFADLSKIFGNCLLGWLAAPLAITLLFLSLGCSFGCVLCFWQEIQILAAGVRVALPWSSYAVFASDFETFSTWLHALQHKEQEKNLPTFQTPVICSIWYPAILVNFMANTEK